MVKEKMNIKYFAIILVILLTASCVSASTTINDILIDTTGQITSTGNITTSNWLNGKIASSNASFSDYLKISSGMTDFLGSTGNGIFLYNDSNSQICAFGRMDVGGGSMFTELECRKLNGDYGVEYGIANQSGDNMVKMNSMEGFVLGNQDRKMYPQLNFTIYNPTKTPNKIFTIDGENGVLYTYSNISFSNGGQGNELLFPNLRIWMQQNKYLRIENTNTTDGDNEIRFVVNYPSEKVARLNGSEFEIGDLTFKGKFNWTCANSQCSFNGNSLTLENQTLTTFNTYNSTWDNRGLINNTWNESYADNKYIPYNNSLFDIDLNNKTISNISSIVMPNAFTSKRIQMGENISIESYANGLLFKQNDSSGNIAFSGDSGSWMTFYNSLAAGVLADSLVLGNKNSPSSWIRFLATEVTPQTNGMDLGNATGASWDNLYLKGNSTSANIITAGDIVVSSGTGISANYTIQKDATPTYCTMNFSRGILVQSNC